MRRHTALRDHPVKDTHLSAATLTGVRRFFYTVSDCFAASQAASIASMIDAWRFL